MKLLILDGNSVINRAFYGVRDLTTREGLHTNAIFGFLNILQRMETEEQPDAVCVAFDLHGPTFRHLRYDGYKATRHPMPEELAQQMPVMKEILGAMNIPIYECQGWEADDVIGTVGRLCGRADWNCVIVTGDRDSMQLIDGHVKVKLVISKAGQTTTTLYDEAMFREEYGFEPKKLVDLKALMGDSSDNIPGVAGVGPKTAKDLLWRFGSLDGVYENLNDASIRPKLREKLEAGKDSAYLSYELATIRPEAPIAFRPEDAMVREPDKPTLYDLFMRLEFTRLIDKYRLRDAALAPKPQKDMPRLGGCDCLPEPGTLCAVVIAPDGTAAVAWSGGVCAVTPLERGGSLQALLGPETPKICHDLKAMLHILEEQELPGANFTFDTALAAYDLNPGQGDYSVNRLAMQYLGREAQDPEAQAEAVWQLAGLLRPMLEEAGMKRLYRGMELPLCPVLFDMERTGVMVDRDTLTEFGTMLTQRITAAEQSIYAYAGSPFNINSPKQLGEVLFEKLGLPPVKKTKTGKATNVHVLQRLRHKHPNIGQIKDYRMLTKIYSTYVEGLLKVIGPDGRVHTTFQNMVTATGRLSSTEPNIQNIPVRTELGSEMRKMFVPGPGNVLVDADYSQIELRVLAHIAGDPMMQEAFRSGQDIHTVTASQVFGVAPEEVTPLQRRSAKAVNFGIVYGISEFSLSEDIGVSRLEAKAYINGYLEKYAGVRAYMHDVVEQAKRLGYVSTLYGRRRYIPELKSSNYNIRQSAERMAMNAPIQGTAADIIKLAMLRVSKALAEAGLKAKLILQVHDELIVECPEAEGPQVLALMKDAMEHAAELSVPLTVDAKIGKSWYETK